MTFTHMHCLAQKRVTPKHLKSLHELCQNEGLKLHLKSITFDLIWH